ncbi:lipid II:glycine glycyltransferase FemX [Labilibaculum antarcticum]|uniref:BioF2-like acetyltransferase domain-containing protein n=1 Tax=Labilibaculum antarcticum TaxID=1717717 RepID=A0A1Y1CQT1_9BACT|nr:peptidoglycan bridge formation glycyltransferase FemA/FemB family protein [Labilibaculum antarcticum]BAX82614.1 hypothetical protein ALGA_4324 [Labilibaculum antarcticum]
MINKYKISWTKSEENFTEWNLFLKNNPRGHCQQVSHWLSSFQAYGADSELLLIKNEKESIIAGIGVIHIGIPYLKVMIASGGPVLAVGFEDLFEQMIELFLQRAKQKKAFYCHINVPVLKEYNASLSKHCLEAINKDSLFFTGQAGNRFTSVASINGLRPIIIKYDQAESAYDFVFNRFTTNTKRNIKQAYKNELDLRFIKTEAEIEEAYAVIEEIAKYHNYTVREWGDSKEMLMSMVKDGLCIVPCCYAKGKLIGALILFEIGQRLTYVSGGILRENKDLKVGHFLQNEMLKYSIEKGYSFYDISVLGGAGVTKFKEGFKGHHLEFIGNRYWVLNKLKFSIYWIFSSFLSKNKALIFKFRNLIST